MNISSQPNKIREGFVGQRMIVLPPDIRRRVEENTLTKSLHLTAIGFYPNANYHDRQRKLGSPEFIILYCTEGEGYVNMDNKEIHLTPNHFIIIPPAKPHHYRSSTSNPWSIYWVHFMGAHADAIYTRHLEFGRSKIRPFAYDQIWLDTFIEIIDILESDFSNKNLEVANMNILYLISALIYHTAVDATHEDDAISKSIEFLKNNLGQKPKVGQLAKQQNLSVSRYSELFKEKTGFSPIKYFNNLKIQKSCQYLYFTDMSIKEICKEIGFDDQYYFSRTFKKLMGMAPSKYRVSHKQHKFLEK